MRGCSIGLVVGLLLSCGTAQAAYTLGAANPYSIEGEAWQVAIGDVTGDGRKDVVALAALNGTAKLYVYSQKADGTLSLPRAYALSNFAVTLVMADLNRDGIQDLVVGGNGSVITTLVSDIAAPVPLKVKTWDTGVISHRIALGRIDRDDYLDVVSINGITSPVTAPVYFRGDGAGGIAPRPIGFSRTNLIAASGNVDVGDANGDGADDVLVGAFDGSLRLLYNNRGYGFAAPLTIDPGFLVEEAVIGDFNSDGRNDVVAAGAVTGPTYLYLFDQADVGPAYDIATRSLPSANGLAMDALIGDDLDGDGRKDLLVGHRSALGVYFQGAAGLGAETPFPLGVSEVTGLAVGDVNGDGCKDLAIAGYTSDLNVYYGSGCAGSDPATLPDLKVGLTASLTTATVKLATIVASIPINQPLLEISATVSSGTLQGGALPAGCVVRAQTSRSRQIDCLVASLAPATTTSLAIPLGVNPDPAIRSRLEVSVRALTDTREQSLLNNLARETVGIEPAPVAPAERQDVAPRTTLRSRAVRSSTR